MKNNELQLVTFEQALRLKKAGFDWPTNGDNSNDNIMHIALMEYRICSAPTVALALKWMRDVKGMFGIVSIFFGYDEHGVPYDEPRYGVEVLNQSRTTIVDLDDYGHNGAVGYPTYEAAESALLDELLTIIDNQ